MCGHKQFGIWEVSKITVVDSNVVNHWLMTGAINIPTILIVTVNNCYLDNSQMPICLCPHIPHIPKSFGSHLFCVNIRAAHSHMHTQLNSNTH